MQPLGSVPHDRGNTKVNQDLRITSSSPSSHNERTAAKIEGGCRTRCGLWSVLRPMWHERDGSLSTERPNRHRFDTAMCRVAVALGWLFEPPTPRRRSFYASRTQHFHTTYELSVLPHAESLNSQARARMLRYTTLFVAFFYFLSIVVHAAPIIADSKNTQRPDGPRDGHVDQADHSSTTAHNHWVDMFDNLQPLPTPQTPEARSPASMRDPPRHRHQVESHEEAQYHQSTGSSKAADSDSRAALQEELSGFNGPFAHFITGQYGTNLNVTGSYLKGVFCGLAMVIAAVAIVTSMYIVVGQALARRFVR